MSVGRVNQIERQTDQYFATANDKWWGIVKHSHKQDKIMKNRRERRRARKDPECMPEYNRYYDYEW